MVDCDLQADILGPELDSYVQTQQLLVAAAHHDLEALRNLLRTVPATVRDESTGYTALHTAIAALAPGKHQDGVNEGSDARIDGSAASAHASRVEQIEAAKETIRLLLKNGAIWNDLDANDETPGCLAHRLGLTSLYEIIVDAGVRAELLLNRLDDFEMLDDGENSDGIDGDADGDENEPDETATEAAEIANAAETAKTAANTTKDEPTASMSSEDVEAATPTIPLDPPSGPDKSTSNPTYLSSTLSFTANRILDSSANGVMMAWESSLMHRSASRILPTPGLSILNIGFGMGIFDSYVQSHLQPSEHHIIEAHPDVLSCMPETGWDPAAASYEKNNVTLHKGTWQDVLPRLVEQNLTFDAIYFDTFAEDYKAFKEFFSESVIALLKPEGRWSFFHGLGADRQVCYDVYSKVVEMDLFEAGFEMEWGDVELPELRGEEQEQWKGVKRSYFSVEKYRLPICRFLS